MELCGLPRWLNGKESACSEGDVDSVPGLASRGSAGEYQADEQAGVARLRWRVPGR